MLFKSKQKLILILLVLFVCAGYVSESKAQQINLKIQGSIVMYEPAGFLSNTSGTVSTYVVKISEVLSGKESSQYILMLSTQKFAKNQFNLKRIQEFNLIRSDGWDDKINNTGDFLDAANQRRATTRLIPSKGVKVEGLPLDVTLPAYLFFGNDYPNKWWEKKN